MKLADSACMPTGTWAVARLATPFTTVTGLQKFTPSTWNCTEPAGVAVLGATAFTVAVRVTG